MDMRFWNVDPLRHSSSVLRRDVAVFTGEDGSIHPAPVPAEPGGEKTFRDVDDDDVVAVAIVAVLGGWETKDDASRLIARTARTDPPMDSRGDDDSFMVGFCVEEMRGVEENVTSTIVSVLESSKYIYL